MNVGTGLPPKLLTRDGRINHEEHEKLAQEDWEIDNGGMGFLDYERFASCWFQVLSQCLSRCVGGVFDRETRRRGDGVPSPASRDRESPPYAIDASHAIDARFTQIADQFTDKMHSRRREVRRIVNK